MLGAVVKHVVGFDCEWDPSSSATDGAQLLQLATIDRVFIIDFKAASGWAAASRNDLTLFLSYIFKSPTIIKVQLSVQDGDIKQIARAARGNVP